MNAVYGATGMTKQNFHQRLDRYLIRHDEQAQMVKVMHQVRQDHPAMGAESMYRLLSPQTMGRDRFEAVYQSHGFVLGRNATIEEPPIVRVYSIQEPVGRYRVDRSQPGIW